MSLETIGIIVIKVILGSVLLYVGYYFFGALFITIDFVYRIIIDKYFAIKPFENAKIRNRIFKESLPILQEKGFVKTPFKNQYFGSHFPGMYKYTLFRFRNNDIEKLYIEIYKKNDWILVTLNVFQIDPPISSVNDLVRDNIFDCFASAKAKTSELNALALNDKKRWLISIFGKRFSLELKPIFWWTSKEKREKQLKENLEKVFNDIDHKFDLWREKYVPFVADKTGKIAPLQPEGTCTLSPWYKDPPPLRVDDPIEEQKEKK